MSHLIAVALHGYAPDRRKHYCATELKPSARSVLTAHHARFEHVFVNVLDRLCAADRQLLEGLVRQHLDEYARQVDSRDQGIITVQELHDQKRSTGSAMVDALCEQLETMEFSETAPCIVHDGECPWSPRSNPAYKDYIWVETAGNTCCPWSQMSSTQSMWLDSATLPFLVSRRSETFFGASQFIGSN